MPKIYPSDSKIEFILAESIRHEGSGKLSILGYVAKHTITLVRPPTLPVGLIPSVTVGFAFALRDGEGTFSGKIEIYDPAGNLVGFGDLEPVIKKPDEPNITYMNIGALPIQSSGDYEFILILDATHRYKRTVTITA